MCKRDIMTEALARTHAGCRESAVTAGDAPRTYTFDEYLAVERAAEFRHELVDGVIRERARSNLAHNLIVGNLAGEGSRQLKGRPEQVFAVDMRVKVEATGRVAYPDVVIVCGDPRFADGVKDTLLNPLVLIEVLSPSTEADDRGEKFAHYRRIDSLAEYVLVSQDRARVEHYRRQGEQWLLTEYSGVDSALELPTVDCRIPLQEIYDKVEFGTGAPSEIANADGPTTG
jgi:Uma2 family endonuclease